MERKTGEEVEEQHLSKTREAVDLVGHLLPMKLLNLLILLLKELYMTYLNLN